MVEEQKLIKVSTSFLDPYTNKEHTAKINWNHNEKLFQMYVNDMTLCYANLEVVDLLQLSEIFEELREKLTEPKEVTNAELE